MSTKQITVKVSTSIVERADDLREYLTEESGIEMRRADVLRRALSLGLRQLAQRRRDGARALQPGEADDEAAS